MPSARELLPQVEELIRNRARAVDTDIPELTEAVSEGASLSVAGPLPVVASLPVAAPVPTSLDEVPELTDAVEEIEITSIAEMPEDDEDPSTLQAFEAGETAALPHLYGVASELAPQQGDERFVANEESFVPKVDEEHLATADIPAESVDEIEVPMSISLLVPFDDPDIANAESLVELSLLKEAEAQSTTSPQNPPLIIDSALVSGAPKIVAGDTRATAADNWARWEALGDEIRMQVLHRIELFSDSAFREQLNAELQPIVDRAGAELVKMIGVQVGELLRSHTEQVIEDEMEKRRKGNA